MLGRRVWLNFFDSIQLSLRKFWFCLNSWPTVALKNWFKSTHDSKWFSGIWFISTRDSNGFPEFQFKSSHDWKIFPGFWYISTHDSKSFPEFWFKLTYDRKTSGILVRINSLLNYTLDSIFGITFGGFTRSVFPGNYNFQNLSDLTWCDLFWAFEHFGWSVLLTNLFGSNHDTSSISEIWIISTHDPSDF